MNTTKYLQTDSRWSGLDYPKSPCTIGKCGCGEVSICNAIIEMERYKGYTPKTIQPYCKQYADKGCNGTYHSGIPAMMKNYGLTEVKEHATMDSLWKELAKGDRVAIYLMGSRLAGTKKVRWTGSGHFVCSTAYKYKDNDHWVYMKDSNSHSSLRNGWISYKGNIRGDCVKVWSGKLTGKLTDGTTVSEVKGVHTDKKVATIVTEKRYIETLAVRNVYDTPKKKSKIMQMPKGSKVYVTKRQNNWLYVDALKGWISETDGNPIVVKTISMRAKQYITSRVCPARSLPVRGSKVNKDLKKGTEFKGRDLVSGYRYAEKIGWVTDSWIKEKIAPQPATIIDEELNACPVQAEWMKNYTYKWESSPTVAKSKKYGTCVTYVACVLQRIKVLKSGEYIWHNASGKVVGAKADKMSVSYPSGTIKGNKSKLKRGDIVMAGNKSATQAGGSSHIFILTGEWDSKGNPYIWDNNSAHRIRDGKAGRHTYNGDRKIIAIVRLK